MTIFTYSRVSTLDQDTAVQNEILAKAYPDAVHREEKATGTNITKRPVLQLLLDMMGEGDKLVVWKLDRLARNQLDLLTLVKQLEEKVAAVEILDQKIDTSTATGKAFLSMLGVFAEFETNLRKERQMAGIAKAKAEGRALGRKRTTDHDAIIKMIHAGDKPAVIAKALNVSRPLVYKIKKQLEAA